MNDNVVDALGIRAVFFTLKREKCFTAADLQPHKPLAVFANQTDTDAVVRAITSVGAERAA